MAFLIFSLIPRGEIASTTSSLSSSVLPATAAPISRPDPSLAHSTGTAPSSTNSDTPRTEPISSGGKKGVARPLPGAMSHESAKDKQPVANENGDGLATKPSPAKKDAPDTAPRAEQLVSAADIATAKSAPANVAGDPFDPAILKRKANKKYSISKYLSTPETYAGQIVVPAEMFQLVRSQSDRVAGHRKIWAIGRKIESRKNNTLGMSSTPSVELEVEPNLAERLDRLGQKKLTENVSILTLWFTSRRECVLVRVEILEEYTLGLKKATYYPEGDVDYKTLRISPDGEVFGKAPDEDWEQPERMLHFAQLRKESRRL